MEITSLSPILSPEEARMLSPLQLAYVGDAVHALMVRVKLIGDNLRVKDMHIAATRAVNAVSQARALQDCLPALSEEELSIVKRGRNAHPHHSAPRSASVHEYANATGLEALLGFLYLTGNFARLMELSHYLYGEAVLCPPHN